MTYRTSAEMPDYTPHPLSIKRRIARKIRNLSPVSTAVASMLFLILGAGLLSAIGIGPLYLTGFMSGHGTPLNIVMSIIIGGAVAAILFGVGSLLVIMSAIVYEMADDLLKGIASRLDKGSR